MTPLKKRKGHFLFLLPESDIVDILYSRDRLTRRPKPPSKNLDARTPCYQKRALWVWVPVSEMPGFGAGAFFNFVSTLTEEKSMSNLHLVVAAASFQWVHLPLRRPTEQIEIQLRKQSYPQEPGMRLEISFHFSPCFLLGTLHNKARPPPRMGERG